MYIKFSIKDIRHNITFHNKFFAKREKITNFAHDKLQIVISKL